MEVSRASGADPQEDARRIARSLREIKTHCLDDAAHALDPGLKSLMLAAAEVLGGLERAFQNHRDPSDGWGSRH